MLRLSLVKLMLTFCYDFFFHFIEEIAATQARVVRHDAVKYAQDILVKELGAQNA